MAVSTMHRCDPHSQQEHCVQVNRTIKSIGTTWDHRGPKGRRDHKDSKGHKVRPYSNNSGSDAGKKAAHPPRGPVT
jgi:hypothetical protein